MLLNTWGEVFTTSLQGLWLGLMAFLPQLIMAIVVFIIGWVVAGLVGRAIAHVFSALKIDRLFQSAGVHDVFNRAGFRFTVGELIGTIVRWFIIIVFLMAALEIVGLVQVNEFLRQVVAYLPNVIIAALILMVAGVVADALKKIITGSARAANVRTATMMGSIASYAVWIFAFIIALSQLGIAPQLMQILFTGIVAMLGLAGGLAFGLGGRDAASRTIDNVSRDMKSNG